MDMLFTLCNSYMKTPVLPMVLDLLDILVGKAQNKEISTVLNLSQKYPGTSVLPGYVLLLILFCS